MLKLTKIVLPATLSCLLLLSACSPPRKVAVEERNTVTKAEEREKLGGAHVRIVAPGDTLYGIAFANGLDAQALAAWNNIGDTGKLRVGQRIRLTKPFGFVAKARTKAGSNVSTGVIKTEPSQSGVEKKRNSQRPSATPREPDLIVKSTSKAQSTGWRWPTAGKVVQRFNNSSGEQGVDIAGSLGQPINASRAGEVVYVGNGLKGYGNLVILKHDEEFLSAYAHNQETFVQEGQKLAVGARIATMGRNRKEVMLHFQIRRHGDPVDPLRYLAPR